MDDKQMTATEYQVRASRTIPKDMKLEDRIHHACFGLMSEVGEVMGVFQKTYQGHDLDRHRIMYELGDALWFLADLCGCFDLGLDEVMRANIAKLEKRYPIEEGFTAYRSLHRQEGDL